MQEGKGKAQPANLQEVFQLPEPHSKSNSRYCLHKLGRQKNRNVTRSLHSIEVNRQSLHPKPKHTTNTIVLSDRDMDSAQKPLEMELAMPKKGFMQRIMRLKSKSLAEKLQTIECEELQEKERKVKGCIEAMQGVLEQIQNQKSSRKMFKSIRYPQQEHSGDKRSALFERQNKEEGREREKGERHEKSKFESYIKNVCKSRENSKILLIRKAKTKSTLITHEELKYSVAANSKRFQTINSQQTKPQRTQSKGTPKIDIIVEKREQGELELEQMQVSAIERVNQSSFISDCGKKELIGELRVERKSLLFELEERKSRKESSDCQTGSGEKREKVSLENNHRKLCKVKNNKKLQSIFPSGFF